MSCDPLYYIPPSQSLYLNSFLETLPVLVIVTSSDCGSKCKCLRFLLKVP